MGILSFQVGDVFFGLFYVATSCPTTELKSVNYGISARNFLPIPTILSKKLIDLTRTIVLESEMV